MIEDVTAAPNPESEPMAKKAAPKKRAKRKVSSPKKVKRAAATRKSSKKRSGPGRKGYSPEKKAEILAATRKGKMTGAQVAAKFGISTLTFYRWRGPVRGTRTRSAAGRVKVDERVIRREVQRQIQKMLPRIIKEEVGRALGSLR